MKLLYNLTLLLLFPVLITANNLTNWEGKHTKKKTINKSYDVSSNATLKIDNKYGNLDIVTWDQNKIVFEIIISTNGNDLQDVQEKLDDITVDFSANDTYVSAQTRIGTSKKSSWWNWNSKNNVNIKINYLVKMPKTNNVDLTNDYGSINLGTLEGNATINCDYGKITTKELLGTTNNLTFDYTNNSYFEYINKGRINADYSGYTVAKAKQLDIIADYTNSLIEIAENVNYNCDYGSLRVNNINNLKGNGDYLTVVVGDVYKNISIEADYGSIKIEKMTKNAGNVFIDSDYVGIKIGIDSQYAFDFEIDLDYGGLSGDDDFEFNLRDVKSTSKHYKGYNLKSSSGNLIRINSDYGSVTFDNK